MKKNLVILTLIILFITALMAIKYLNESYRVEVEVRDIENKLLNEKINDYEYLMERFFAPSDDSTFDVLNRAYKASGWIHIDGKKVPLPKNGKIYTDAKQVEFEFIVVKPPTINHLEISDYLSSFDELYNYFDMPVADEYNHDGDNLRFKYGNLELGDKLELNINYDLSRLLNMTNSKIEVVVTDQFDSGADYMPRNIELKRYRGGYENAGFEEHYTYLSDTTCKKVVIDSGTMMSFIYEYNDDLRITHKEGEGMELAPYERIYLPKVIKLGETWKDMYSTKMITGVDIEIETPLGIFKAIEVTSDYAEEQGKYDRIVAYYTKELGLIFSSFYGLEDEIVEVKYGE